MPRPPTPQSVHSWWSYSNPTGATIPLHPIASQLAKFLYHRQVVGMIKQQKGHPLSETELDAFIPYLQSNEIRGTTKLLILQQIQGTAKFVRGIRAILEAGILPVLVQGLRSQDEQVPGKTASVLETCFHGFKRILPENAMQELTITLKDIFVNFVEPLVSLRIDDMRGNPQLLALAQVKHMSDFDDGIHAILQTHLPSILIQLLHCEDTKVQGQACTILETIFYHGSLRILHGYCLLNSDLCLKLGHSLLLLLRNSREKMQIHALYILNALTCKKLLQEVFKNVLNIGTISHPLAHLLDSTSEASACDVALSLLRNFLSYLTISEILDYIDSNVVPIVIKGLILSSFVHGELGAKTQRTFLLIYRNLLSSPDRGVFQESCSILCNIATAGSEVVLLATGIVPALATVLVRQDAAGDMLVKTLGALSCISLTESGARTIITANALLPMIELLCFNIPPVLEAVHGTLRKISRHKRLLYEYAFKIPKNALVSVLSGPVAGDTVSAIISILAAIKDREKAVSVQHERIVISILVGLLHSRNENIVSWACSEVSELAQLEPDHPDFGQAGVVEALVSLIRNPLVKDDAMNALFYLKVSPEEIAETKYKEMIPTLFNQLHPQNPAQSLFWAGSFLCSLAKYGYVSDPILNKLQVKIDDVALALLLSHPENSIVESTAAAVAQTCRWPCVAVALVASERVIPTLFTLLSSSETNIVLHACMAFEHLGPSFDLHNVANLILRLAALCGACAPDVRSAAASALCTVIKSEVLETILPCSLIASAGAQIPDLLPALVRRLMNTPIGQLSWFYGMSLAIANDNVCRKGGSAIQLTRPSYPFKALRARPSLRELRSSKDSGSRNHDVLPVVLNLARSRDELHRNFACVVLAYMCLRRSPRI